MKMMTIKMMTKLMVLLLFIVISAGSLEAQYFEEGQKCYKPGFQLHDARLADALKSGDRNEIECALLLKSSLVDNRFCTDSQHCLGDVSRDIADLVIKKASPEALQKTGSSGNAMTVLMKKFHHNFPMEWLKIFSSKKVSPDARNHMGESARSIACMSDNEALAKALNAETAHPLFKKNQTVWIYGADKTTILRTCEKVALVSINGKTTLENYSVIKTSDTHSAVYAGNLLFSAAESGDTDGVKKALEGGALINAKNPDDLTALMLASMKGRTGTVRLLIEKGADVNVKRNNGNTALMSASFQGHLDVVKLLIKAKADVNMKRNNGVTALMDAREKGHSEIARVLIESGAIDPDRTPAVVNDDTGDSYSTQRRKSREYEDCMETCSKECSMYTLQHTIKSCHDGCRSRCAR